MRGAWRAGCWNRWRVAGPELVTFALLSETELRLVDLMFDAGALHKVPAVVRPPEERGPASPRIRSLVSAAPQIEATARRAGGLLEHGSIDELLRMAEQHRDNQRGDDGSPRR